MATLIQIKRSLTTAAVGSLANGELAYTANGDILSIGSNATIVHIGGKRVPGTLTANQALVANATSAIDKVIVANAVITYLTANGALGTASQLLSTNSTGGIFWTDSTPSTNVNAQFAFTNTISFSNTITFTGSILANTVNATSYTAGVFGSAVSGSVANSTVMAIGNTTVNVTINSTSFSGSAASLGGTAAANFVQNTDSRTLSGNLHMTGANTGFSTGYFVGGQPGAAAASVSANTTALLVGNSTVSTTVNSTAFSGSANNAAYLGGTVASDYALKTYADDKAGNAYSNALSFTLSRDGSYTGNNTFGGTTTTINSNAALAGSVTLGDSTADIVSITGRVNTSIVPSANNLYDLGTTLLRFSTVHASNVASVDGNFSGDVSVSGNLTVSGTLTTIDTVNLKVKDALIELADTNTSTDTLDIGFFGRSGNASATFYHGLVRDTATSPSLTSAYFRLFSTNTAPTTVVNTAAVGYNQGTLFAYLNSAALTSNTTKLAIVANSSYQVAFDANTLTLTTALVATSGGTGFNTYTSGELLVANTGNAFSKLALGTDGHILQSNGSALIYATLDAGTF